MLLFRCTDGNAQATPSKESTELLSLAIKKSFVKCVIVEFWTSKGNHSWAGSHSGRARNVGMLMQCPYNMTWCIWCIYWQLPTRGFSVTIYNSRGNQIDIAQIAIYNYFLQIKCWFLVRGENRSTRGKTSHSRVENQQTQSTFDAECGNRTRATLVEGKCAHH